MSFITYLLGWVLLAFAVGSVPFGWLVGKLGGIDVTKQGSGNIGMTNVWRIMGWKAGLSVFILDMLKGLLPVLALGYCRTQMPAGMVPPVWEQSMGMVVGICSVLGHTFTPWLRFKGGKGVATGCGVLIGLFQVWSLPVLAIFILVSVTTRMISVGSLMAVIFIVAFSLSIPDIRHLWPFAIMVAALVFWTHRENIKRLMAGTENKFSFSTSKAKKQAADADKAE